MAVDEAYLTYRSPQLADVQAILIYSSLQTRVLSMIRYSSLTSLEFVSTKNLISF